MLLRAQVKKYFVIQWQMLPNTEVFTGGVNKSLRKFPNWTKLIIDFFLLENGILIFTKFESPSRKLVDKFTYLGSSVSSTEKDIDTRLTKAWTAIDRLSIIWKSDLTDKMKRSFFQAAVVSILLYGCTTWTLTKRLEKKLDGNYTRMLRAILNKSWRQHPTKHQLYGHLPPITKTIQVRRTRHAGHCWRSKDELISDVLWWIPAYGRAKAGPLARTYSSYVRIRDVALKTCLRRWMIGISSERGSEISVLAARHWWWWILPLTKLLSQNYECHSINKVNFGNRKNGLQLHLFPGHQ